LSGHEDFVSGGAGLHGGDQWQLLPREYHDCCNEMFMKPQNSNNSWLFAGYFFQVHVFIPYFVTIISTFRHE